MRMAPLVLVLGAAAVLLAALLVTVAVPMNISYLYEPSDIARPLNEKQLEGKKIYMREGCWYCHTQQVRDLPQDALAFGGRVSLPGDYAYDRPVLLGTERTGPDLALIGGKYSDDWHLAHFINPRYTVPASLMPRFDYLSRDELEALIAYVQSLGGKPADERAMMQRKMKEMMLKALETGEEERMMEARVPADFRKLKNPVLPTQAGVEEGRAVFEFNCVGCHGSRGDGDGPAAEFLDPKPADFTDPGFMNEVSDGRLYYSILFGIPGTAMHPFGDKLTVDEIWNVINYLRTLPEEKQKEAP